MIFGLLLAAIGAGVTIWGVANVRRGLASRLWPTTEGSVITSEVARSRSTSTGRTRKTTTQYSANTEYEYTVNEVPYKGDRVSFGQFSSNNRNAAQLVVSRYRVGDTVQVHYNPDNPAMSVLEPGVGIMTYLPAGIGVLLAIGGVISVVVSLGKRETRVTSDTPLP